MNRISQDLHEILINLVNPVKLLLVSSFLRVFCDHKGVVMVFSRSFLAALFLLFSISVVNAYTVVMRDGRRVEIPNEFTVTNSTLTYDVGNGMQITIQLNAVDIAATERANTESAGALLRRATETPVSVEPQRRTNAGRTITNADLEKFRQARVQSETQRKELGLPSLEERQQEVALIDDRTLEQVRSMRAQEEAYWRMRAEAARAEAAANGGRSSDNVRFVDSFGSFPGFFDGGIGFGVTGGRFNRFGRFQSSPFDGFLATPITPFPTFRSNPGRFVFQPRGIRSQPHGRRGSHR
jgi:hypothetical protein